MRINMQRLGTILLFVFLGLTVIKPMPVNAAQKPVLIEVKNSGAAIAKGKTVKLTASLKNGKLKKAAFQSRSKGIATVTASGKVTGKKAGAAEIVVTVTAADGQKLKKNVTIFVKDKSVKAMKEQIHHVDLIGHKTIARGNTGTVTLNHKNNYGKIMKILYKSSNPSIATVNKKGIIRAKNSGTAKIAVTATTKSGYLIKAALKITVPANVLTRSGGVNYYHGVRETWYTQKMFPGNGLKIPGRHIRKDGVICDKDGYVVVALTSGNKGQIVETSLGTGKCYDKNGSNGVDIYTNW